MAHYVVLRDCYAMGRLWLKGEEVELAGVRVPCHFKEIKGIGKRIADRDTGALVTVPGMNGNTATGNASVQPGSTENAAVGSEKQEPAGAEQPDVGSLEKMDVFTLHKLANEAGLELPKTAKKEEIIAALRGEE